MKLFPNAIALLAACLSLTLTRADATPQVLFPSDGSNLTASLGDNVKVLDSWEWRWVWISWGGEDGYYDFQEAYAGPGSINGPAFTYVGRGDDGWSEQYRADAAGDYYLNWTETRANGETVSCSAVVHVVATPILEPTIDSISTSCGSGTYGKSYEIYVTNPQNVIGVVFSTWSAVRGENTANWQEGEYDAVTNRWKLTINRSGLGYGTSISKVSLRGPNGILRYYVGQVQTDFLTPAASSITNSGTPTGIRFYKAYANNVQGDVVRVLFPSWSDANGQDDLVWHEGTYDSANNRWVGRIDQREHRWERGGYTTHVYAVSSLGVSYFVGATNVVVVESTDPDADFDNDGMPDDYEYENYLDPYDASDANKDADNDGIVNIDEYNLWLYPNIPQDPSALNCIAGATNVVFGATGSGPGQIKIKVLYAASAPQKACFDTSSLSSGEEWRRLDSDPVSTGNPYTNGLQYGPTRILRGEGQSFQVEITGEAGFDFILQPRIDFPAWKETRSQRLLINGKPIEGITKQEIIDAGCIVKISVDHSNALSFAATDFSQLKHAQFIEFGLGAGIAGRSMGILAFQATACDVDYMGGLSGHGLIFESGGGAVPGDIRDTPAHVQVRTPVGFVDVLRKRNYYEIVYYPKGDYTESNGFWVFDSTPVASYRIERRGYTQPPICPAEVELAERILVTRTIGTETRLYKIETDWLKPYVPSFPGSLSRIWAWHAPDAAAEGSTEVLGSVGMTYTSWFEGSGSARTLLQKENIEYAPGSYTAPIMKHTMGDGQDLTYLRERRSLMLSSWITSGTVETLAQGGVTRTEDYKAETLNGQSRYVIGKKQYEFSSFLNEPLYSSGIAAPEVGYKNPYTGACINDERPSGQSVVSETKYTSGFIDGRLVEAEIITKQGQTAIGRVAHTYVEGTFDGSNSVLRTTTEYAGSSTSGLSTLNLRYSCRLDDLYLRERLISTTRSNGTRTSYAYQRGTLNGTTWTASDTGGYFLIAELSGAVDGSTIGTYRGKKINPLALDPHYSTVTERIMDPANRVVREATLVYTGGTTFALLNGVNYSYDAFGHLCLKKTDDGRTLFEAAYSNGKKIWEADEQGITISYTYDSHDRLKTKTCAAVSGASASIGARVTTYTYDAAGRLKSTTESSAASAEKLVTSYSYNTAGRPITRTLPGNLVTQSSSEHIAGDDDGYRRQETTTLPGGGTKIETFYKDGRLASVTGTSGPDVTYDYSYNSDGNLVSTQTDSTGRTVTAYTDYLGRTLSTETATYDGGTLRVNNSYNSRGQLVKQVTSEGAVKVALPRLFEYDSFGRLTRAATDANANDVIDDGIDYDVKSPSALFVQQQMPRLDDGAVFNPTPQWYLLEKETIWPYSGSGSAESRIASQRYTQVTGLSPTLSAHTIAYDFDGNWAQTVTTLDRASALARTTTHTKGSSQAIDQVSLNGLPISTTNAQGQTALLTYDALGRPDSSTDPRIGATDYVYEAGTTRVQGITAPDGQTNVCGYDAAGRVASRTNAQGKTDYFGYDTQGNLTHQWGATVNPVRYEYNELGQRIKMHTYRSGVWTGAALPSAFADAGDLTTWSYQATTGLLLSKTDAKGAIMSYTYNALGQIATRTDARNILTTYTYTPRNLLWTVSYNDGVTTSLTYTYDRSGRQSTVTDAAGQRSFGYYDTPDASDAQNGSARLKDENLPAFLGSHILTRTYQYDVAGRANGRASGIKLDSGSLYNVTYGYDAVLRLSQVAYNDLTPFTYTYTDNSNLVATVEQLTSASTWNYARDYTYRTDSNRLAQLTHAWAASNPVTTRLGYYGLDSIEPANSFGLRAEERTSGTAYANLLSLSGGSGSYTNYSYSDRAELIASAKYLLNADGGAGAPQAGAARTYVMDSMGNRTADLNGTYTPNSLNQYAATPFSAVTVYDASGNPLDDGTRSYAYDAENRLIRVTQGSSVWNYKYDYLGRRIEKSGTGLATTRYLYDGWNLIAELDGIGTITRRFLWGLDASGSLQGAGGVGGLLVIDANLSNAARYYPLYDGSFNVLGLYDGSGNLAAAYQYDPFGNLQAAAGSYSAANPYRSATKYTDGETGFVYYGLRYYSPQLGRFINRDPIEEAGGLNLYAFCGNDGINKYDYLGLEGEYLLDFRQMLTYVESGERDDRSYGKVEHIDKTHVRDEDGDIWEWRDRETSRGSTGNWYNTGSDSYVDFQQEQLRNELQSQKNADDLAVDPNSGGNQAANPGTTTFNAGLPQWSDFKGPVPAGTKFSAGISSGIRTKWDGITKTQIGPNNYKLTFNNITAFAVMNQNLSFVKPSVSTSNDKGAYLLGHENIHFMITRISAAMLQPELRALSITTDTENMARAQNILILQGDRLTTEYRDLANRMNIEYDRQTNHGTIREKQDIFNQNFGIGP